MTLKEVMIQAVLHAVYTALEVLLAYIGTNPFTEMTVSAEALVKLMAGAFIVTLIRWIYANFKKIDFNHNGKPDYVDDEDGDDI